MRTIAGTILVDKHVLAVVDGKRVEYGAQGLDAFAAHLPSTQFHLRMQLELGLPHHSTGKRSSLELERCF